MDLRFDRPFVFDIVHDASGLQLFTSEVLRPEAWTGAPQKPGTPSPSGPGSVDDGAPGAVGGAAPGGDAAGPVLELPESAVVRPEAGAATSSPGSPGA